MSASVRRIPLSPRAVGDRYCQNSDTSRTGPCGAYASALMSASQYTHPLVTNARASRPGASVPWRRYSISTGSSGTTIHAPFASRRRRPNSVRWTMRVTSARNAWAVPKPPVISKRAHTPTLSGSTGSS